MYSEAQNNMTKCVDFYEKLEKDGNFCGLPPRYFKEAMEYWNEYRQDAEKNGGDKSPLTEREWFNQRREANKAVKERSELSSTTVSKQHENAKGERIEQAEIPERTVGKTSEEKEAQQEAVTEMKPTMEWLEDIVYDLKTFGFDEDTVTIVNVEGRRILKVGETPKQKTLEVPSCSCESCGGTDEDAVKVALHILRQYDCPTDICESVQKWIEEKYGK